MKKTFVVLDSAGEKLVLDKALSRHLSIEELKVIVEDLEKEIGSYRCSVVDSNQSDREENFNWSYLYKSIQSEKDLNPVIKKFYNSRPAKTRVPHKVFDILEKSVGNKDSKYALDVLFLYALVSLDKYVEYRGSVVSKYLKKQIEGEKRVRTLPSYYRKVLGELEEMVTVDDSILSTIEFGEDSDETVGGSLGNDTELRKGILHNAYLQRIYLGANYTLFLKLSDIFFTCTVGSKDICGFVKFLQAFLEVDSTYRHVGIFNLQKVGFRNTKLHDKSSLERLDFFVKCIIEKSAIFTPFTHRYESKLDLTSIKKNIELSFQRLRQKQGKKKKEEEEEEVEGEEDDCEEFDDKTFMNDMKKFKEKRKRGKKKEDEESNSSNNHHQQQQEEEEEFEESTISEFDEDENPSSFSFLKSILRHNKDSEDPFSNNCVVNMRSGKERFVRNTNKNKTNHNQQRGETTTSLPHFRPLSLRKSKSDNATERVLRENYRPSSSNFDSKGKPRRNSRRKKKNRRLSEPPDRFVANMEEKPRKSLFNEVDLIAVPIFLKDLFFGLFEIKNLVSHLDLVPQEYEGKKKVEKKIKVKYLQKLVVEGLIKTVRVFLLNSDRIDMLMKLNYFVVYCQYFNDKKCPFNELMNQYHESLMDDFRDFVLTDIQTQPWSSDRRIPFEISKTSYGIRLYEIMILNIYSDMKTMEMSNKVVRGVLTRFFHETISEFNELYSKKISPSERRLPQYMMDVCSVVQLIRVFRKKVRSQAVYSDLLRFLLRCYITYMPLNNLCLPLKKGRGKDSARTMSKYFYLEFFMDRKSKSLVTSKERLGSFYDLEDGNKKELGKKVKKEFSLVTSLSHEPTGAGMYSMSSLNYEDEASTCAPSTISSNISSVVGETGVIIGGAGTPLHDQVLKELNTMYFGFPKNIWEPVVMENRITLSPLVTTRFTRLLSTRFSLNNFESKMSYNLVFTGLYSAGIVGEELKALIRRRPGYMEYKRKRRKRLGRRNKKKEEEEEGEEEEEEDDDEKEDEDEVEQSLLEDLYRMVDRDEEGNW